MRKRVRVGVQYVYEPVLFDKLNPPFNVEPGEMVTVINLPGCPKVNNIGMCYVAKAGKFSGMVCTDSLRYVPRFTPKRYRDTDPTSAFNRYLNGVAARVRARRGR